MWGIRKSEPADGRETLTVTVLPAGRTYEEIVDALSSRLREQGPLDPAISRLIREWAKRQGFDNVKVVESGRGIEFGPYQCTLRPRLAVISMEPAAADFRTEILGLARESGLAAADHQNGYLHLPPDSAAKPWWKFW